VTNTIRVIDFVLDMLPEPIGDISRQAQNHLSGLVAAYDALAPKPDEWPDGATHYAIRPNNQAFWCRGAPIPFQGDWLTDNYQSAGRRELPFGIDWRLCMWKRPEVQP